MSLTQRRTSIVTLTVHFQGGSKEHFAGKAEGPGLAAFAAVVKLCQWLEKHPYPKPDPKMWQRRYPRRAR